MTRTYTFSPADTTGKSCELLKNLCVDENGSPLCKHDGTCHQMGNTVSCECMTGMYRFLTDRSGQTM